VVCVRPGDAFAVLEATQGVVSGHAAVRPALERGEVTSRAEIKQSLLRVGLTVVDEMWR
jgi:hypothetical protein